MANNEFGDFQTPQALANYVVRLVRNLSDAPSTVVEPTCGKGSFVRAVLDAFPAATVHGLEIQGEHIHAMERQFEFEPKLVLHHANYFEFDWDDLFARMIKPVWVIGNPPWVTNTTLMKLDSSNLPKKSPQAHLRGYDAQTGKSNFDISESMIRDWFGWCAESHGTLAVICKTSVARKVLQWWWRRPDAPPAARLHLIDAKAEFGATVSACVLVCSFSASPTKKVCDIFDTLDAAEPSSTFGMIDGHLVSNEATYRRGRFLLGRARPQWRSGIKHDASSILEFRTDNSVTVNKLGEEVQLESDFLYPMMKGSDLAREKSTFSRMMLVPQRRIGDDASRIMGTAPKTWKYLNQHKEKFDARKSAIYKKSGPFSIFGIGEYTFMPWKVAIGALYKCLEFRLVGPISGKPVVFDDTVYFIGFETERDAAAALAYLQLPVVKSFLNSMIFWDDMRPIKTDILNRIDMTMIGRWAA